MRPDGVAEELAQECGLRHNRLAHHVAGGEAVHRIGDGDQRHRADLVGDGGEVGRLLRVGAEQDRVAGLQERVDVVMTRHHVERVFRHHAGGDLQHEAADLLADRHVVRLETVQDALARRRVGDELAAGQRRAQCARLRGMLALRLEEEGVLAPDVATASRTESLVDFGDLGRGCDRIANNASAHMAHHLGDGPVTVNDCRHAGIFCVHLLYPSGT